MSILTHSMCQFFQYCNIMTNIMALRFLSRVVGILPYLFPHPYGCGSRVSWPRPPPPNGMGLRVSWRPPRAPNGMGGVQKDTLQVTQRFKNPPYG